MAVAVLAAAVTSPAAAFLTSGVPSSTRGSSLGRLHMRDGKGTKDAQVTKDAPEQQQGGWMSDIARMFFPSEEERRKAEVEMRRRREGRTRRDSKSVVAQVRARDTSHSISAYTEIYMCIFTVIT